MNGRSGSGPISPTDAINRAVGIQTSNQVTTMRPAIGGTKKTYGESTIN